MAKSTSGPKSTTGQGSGRRPAGPNRNPGGRRRRAGAQRSLAGAEPVTDTIEIFGIHPVAAALNNPARTVHRLFLTANAENRLGDALAASGLVAVRVLPKDLDRRLGPETVHQGALAMCDELMPPSLADVIARAHATGLPIIVLDQVTDPHNLGAVIRSGAVFGCAGIVTTRRHSPPLGGTVAKSASGALELVPVCLIQNLVRALAEIAGSGIATVGLDGAGDAALEMVVGGAAIAVVLGAEGRGLRQSTHETCSHVARISADGQITSLNVSNAAAIALHTHALARRGLLGLGPANALSVD